LTRVVERRMADCGLEDAGLYGQLLERSPEEWEKLVEEVVIPETWFFRDWEPFVFLGDYVTSQWLPSRRGRVFRVLSVPCSSGEEPYSIAMTLLDRGLTGEQFHIDAADISRNALERCRRAVYSSNSFRSERVPRFQGRYFQKTQDGYWLLPEVRGQVRFLQANLLKGQLPLGERPYDAIFCRNMMIYFDDAARDRTIEALRRLLADDGLLFAGYAEAMIMLQSGFAAVDHPRAFAYRQRKSAAPHKTPHSGSRRRETRPARLQRELPRKRGLYGDQPLGKTTAGTPAKPVRAVRAVQASDPDEGELKPTPVQEARRLADEGHLEEAVAICQSIIDQKNASAECYCLLGLIHEASGEQRKAEESFDRALYLQPDYEEALIHLSLILESRGDTSRAEALRDRVRRVEQTSHTKIEQE